MTDKEIIKGNKLIIESPFHCTKYDLPNWDSMNKFFFTDVLKFHSSYDWLMPVIGKIIPLHKNYGNCDGYYFFDGIINSLPKNDIKDTWIYVYSFIEWYNKNKPYESK